jgi:hypothetical protein
VQVQTTVYFATLSFTGILLSVAAVVSFLKFINKPSADISFNSSFRWWHIALGVAGSAAAIYAGNSIQLNESTNWLVLPLLAIPAAALPIWVAVKLGMKNLPVGSRWRTWSVFGMGLTVTPLTIFILEVVIVVVIAFAFIMVIALNPDLASQFESFSTQFSLIDPESEEDLRLLAPFLFQPGVVFTALGFISVLVPLLEELLKPLAVWMLSSRLDSRAQGFALGAVSGAGFALLETFNVSGQADGWSELLFMRIGTGLLHVACSAMMGSAIYLALREKRYLNLTGTYLLVVLLHGTWNAAAIVFGVSELLLPTNLPFDAAFALRLASIVLALLTALFIGILLGFNRALQPAPLTPSLPDTLTMDGTPGE